MSDTTRKAIREKACQALHQLFSRPKVYGISESEIAPTLAALYRVLDTLDSLETMEHVTLRSEPGRFQIMMLAG